MPLKKRRTSEVSDPLAINGKSFECEPNTAAAKSSRSRSLSRKHAVEANEKPLQQKAKNRVVFSANTPDQNGGEVRRVRQNAASSLMEGDEFESDDEPEANRIGDVPLWWYDDHQHIGYDGKGKRLVKSLSGSDITRLLNDADDPDAWRTVTDVKNQTQIKLSDTELEIIRRLKAGKFPVKSYDMTGLDSIVEFDNPEEAIHPSSLTHPPKRRFLPSLSENKTINRLVRLIRSGKIQVDGPKVPEVYDLWGGSIFSVVEDFARGRFRGPPSLPAPKQKLPEHIESYNPPEEYLLDSQEEAEWKNADREDRAMEFLPMKYRCLRHVPGYSDTILERFARCLDLYLCPRGVKKRMNVDPASLLPQLPKAEDLRPFPTRLGLTFDNAVSGVSVLAFDATGSYLAVGRLNGSIEIFDVSLTRCLFAWSPGISEAASALAFNPKLPLLAVGFGSNLYILEFPLPAFHRTDETGDLPSVWSALAALKTMQFVDEGQSAGPEWERFEHDEARGWRIAHSGTVTHVSWHCKGLYFVSVCRHAVSPSQQLGIHSLVKLKTLRPFRTNPAGKIQKAEFHPLKSWLYVAYFKGVRLYNLQKDQTTAVGGLLKKFSGWQRMFSIFLGVDTVVDMTVHPSGEHIAVGGANRRLTWFDYDIGEKPYKIFRHHADSVLSVGFHSHFPLLYSASADGIVHIFHAKVSTDLLSAPTVIPVKKLSPTVDFKTNNSKKIGIEICAWHPSQPWLAVGLDDGNVGLFV